VLASSRGARNPFSRTRLFAPFILCGLHIRHPARVFFGRRRLWCAI
jgi:hypothetical protein